MTAKANSSQNLWNQVVTDYRNACVLRREGKEAEAGEVIERKLPLAIAAWSKADSRPADAKKCELEALFERERQNIDSWLFAQDALASRLSTTLVPTICQHVSEEIRSALSGKPHFGIGRVTSRGGSRQQRVRFDDIPGVIDALLAQQQADYGRQPAFCQ